jgi:mannose-6-phosphate isomerase-like protein (cupin superfamily)
MTTTSNFTVKNLLELNESVSERVPEIEGRFGRTALESRDVGVSHFRYAPNFRSPIAHKHSAQEEVYLVISGSGRVLLDGEVVEVGPWDAVRVGTGVVRAMEAGPEGLEFVAIGGPKPEGGDGEMVDVQWPEAD